MVNRLVIALVVCVVTGAASLAHAQGAVEARAHFDAGAAHARAERWVEALTEFRRSEDLMPRAVTEFNIASALVRLARATEAIDVIRTIEARTDIDDALRRDVAALRLAAEASRRTLVVSASPAELRLQIDGVVSEGEGARRQIVIDPGPHTIVATLEGYDESRQTVAPDQAVLDITLSPRPATLVVEATEPDATIYVDDVARGVGRVEDSLGMGTHSVRVERDGRIPFETDVNVGPGEHLVVPAALAMEPAPPLEANPVFWVAIAGGAAVVIGVVVTVSVVATSPPPAYGGTTGVVIPAIVSF